MLVTRPLSTQQIYHLVLFISIVTVLRDGVYHFTFLHHEFSASKSLLCHPAWIRAEQRGYDCISLAHVALAAMMFAAVLSMNQGELNEIISWHKGDNGTAVDRLNIKDYGMFCFWTSWMIA